MKTSWSEVEDLVNELEFEQRSNDAELVQGLFDEATKIEDDLDAALERIETYNSIFNDIIDLVDRKRKNELLENGQCTKDTQLLVSLLRRYLDISNSN